MKTLTTAQVFQHMTDNVRAGRSPIDRLQVYENDDWCDVWRGVTVIKIATAYPRIRVTPCTHNLNGYDVPAPETEEPDVGRQYYGLNSLEDNGVDGYQWGGDKLDKNALRNGLWLSKEDAIANAKALRGEDPYREAE